jgi:hypothetical protein
VDQRLRWTLKKGISIFPTGTLTLLLIVGVEDRDIDVGGEIAAVVLSEFHVPVGKLRAFIGGHV